MRNLLNTCYNIRLNVDIELVKWGGVGHWEGGDVAQNRIQMVLLNEERGMIVVLNGASNFAR